MPSPQRVCHPQLRAQHDSEMQQQRQSAEQREAELRQEAQEQVSQLVAQVSGLQEELAAVLEFKQQRVSTGCMGTERQRRKSRGKGVMSGGRGQARKAEGFVGCQKPWFEISSAPLRYAAQWVHTAAGSGSLACPQHEVQQDNTGAGAWAAGSSHLIINDGHVTDTSQSIVLPVGMLHHLVVASHQHAQWLHRFLSGCGGCTSQTQPTPGQAAPYGVCIFCHPFKRLSLWCLLLQADHTAVLAALREENQGLRETLSAQKAQLERYYAGLNAKMRKEYEQKLEELKRSGEEELQERLGAGVKRVLGQNRRLAEELQLHVQVGEGGGGVG